MALSLRVLLEGELHHHGPVAEKLSVHALDGEVGCLERIEGHEPKPLARPGSIIFALHLCRYNTAKRTKRVVKNLLIHDGVQITDEKVGAYAKILRFSILQR